MVRICVTSTGADLDSPVDPRFGRCAYFILVDPDTMQFEARPNDAAYTSGGAGIRAAQTVASSGVSAVITGSVGPNALPALLDASIQLYTVPSGTIRSVVEAFKRGELSPISAPGPSHAGYGTAPGTGWGAGRGMGGGGWGRGRGRGGGRGRGWQA